MRAFIAVDLSEGIKEKMKEIQRELRFLSGNAKFVDVSQAHITLKFLGEISEELAAEIQRELASLDAEQFEITFRGVGFFPEMHLEKLQRARLRVIWLGVDDESAHKLRELQSEIDKRMTKFGFFREKDFKPHATIARLKRALTSSELGTLKRKIDMLRDVKGDMLVHTVKLKKSTLTPQGPIYEDLFVRRLSERRREERNNKGSAGGSGSSR